MTPLAYATVTASADRDRDSGRPMRLDFAPRAEVTDLDSYAAGAHPYHQPSHHQDHRSSSHEPAPQPSGRRAHRSLRLAPDLARADAAIAAVAPWRAVVTLSRLSWTFPAGTPLDAVRAILPPLAAAFASLGQGRGAWFAVDVRADGGGPHLYGLAAYARRELAPILDLARALLGGEPECQRVDAVTAWEPFAECDDASRLRPELGKVFAYGAKPWAVGERDPARDVVAAGALARLALSHPTSTRATVTERPCSVCGVALGGENERRATCSDRCRQRLSRSRRRTPHRDTADHVAARLGLTCRECLAAGDEPCCCLAPPGNVGLHLMPPVPAHLASTIEGDASAAPASCSAPPAEQRSRATRVAEASPPPAEPMATLLDVASRSLGGTMASDRAESVPARRFRARDSRRREDHHERNRRHGFDEERADDDGPPLGERPSSRP